ncbi:N-acetyltransferase [Kribbella pittospori]|uniref:N-acetyltransferase n=1 Tax=Kribbella pittospori TaxID=722689 RepID=A0A4R0KF71_9ACTN|nr:N-acetyltransferase [Kribbella pittospori]
MNRAPGKVGRVADDRVVVRGAGAGDRDEVWGLAREFATSFVPERSAFDESYARLLTAAHTLLLVAEVPGQGVVGYLLANSHTTFLANGPVAWVEEVMVDEGVRRMGVGRRLMEHAEEWAQSVGAAYLALASRRAGDFYVALGYEDSATFYKKTFS